MGPCDLVFHWKYSIPSSLFYFFSFYFPLEIFGFLITQISYEEKSLWNLEYIALYYFGLLIGWPVINLVCLTLLSLSLLHAVLFLLHNISE